jgi:hypothetical protein
MLKEIHLTGGVGTPFGSFCVALADVSAVELGKAARQIGIGAGLRRRRNGNRNGP